MNRRGNALPDLPSWMRRVILLDVETTGLDKTRDRITELGWALYEDGKVVEAGQSFVDPEGRSLSDEVAELTGIDPAWLENAPPFWKVFNRLAPLLYGAVPVAYNAPFDRAFIQYAVARAWRRGAFGQLPWLLDPRVRWLDVYGLVPEYISGSRKLGNVASQLHVFELDDPTLRTSPQLHRADIDARVAGEVLFKLYQSDPHPWDDYEALVERARYATYLRRQNWFYGSQRKLGKAAGWLAKGLRPWMYECDVCHDIRPGRLYRKGWTVPSGWCRQDDPRGEMACSAGCDWVRRWHRGG